MKIVGNLVAGLGYIDIAKQRGSFQRAFRIDENLSLDTLEKFLIN
jgi:hypothetical protein